VVEDEQGDAEIAILRIVADRPGLSLRDYGARMGISHEGVRKILERLAAQKLVQIKTKRWSVTTSGTKHLKVLDAGNKDLFS
jgi:predicted ArsR family transcriptional regulator